jgi:TetR/AcrR family transcriptional repressor of nem operon
MHKLQHRKGSDTRDRILDVAEAAILEKGFAATSIDELCGFSRRGGIYRLPDGLLAGGFCFLF